MGRDHFDVRIFAISMVIAATVALAVHVWGGMPYWAAFAITLIALLLNGWLATWEDNQPGGFNKAKNDDGRDKDERLRKGTRVRRSNGSRTPWTCSKTADNAWMLPLYGCSDTS